MTPTPLELFPGRPLLKAGEPAPDFRLPDAAQEGAISLADFAAGGPVLIAVFRGVGCSFCRRILSQLGATRADLEAVGVQLLAVLANEPERSRLYYRYHPAPCAMVADPDAQMLAAYGVPRARVGPALHARHKGVNLDPFGDFGRPLPFDEASDRLARMNPIDPSPSDGATYERIGGVLNTQFLVDAFGVVRWVNLEGATEGFGGFPRAEELVALSRDLGLAG